MTYLLLRLYYYGVIPAFMNHNIKSKLAIIAVGAIAVGMLLTGYNYEASGQVNGTSSKNTSTTKIASNQLNAPKTINITGSIPLRSTIKSAIYSKVKTTLNDAVLTAQKAVGSNSSATSALARPLNGYLVYDIHVRDDNNNTSYAVIVDPGTGKVIYKQVLPTSLSAIGGHPFIFGKDRGGPFFGGRYRGLERVGCYWNSGAGSGFMDNGSSHFGDSDMSANN
jgi:uncharacterized membrane protein YkoI